jgi:3-oxoacid CoA-transferase subunit A/glutaconate CoA-transferase subunit A
MDIIEEGKAVIWSKHDPEEHRRWVLEKKNRSLQDKTMSIKEAVSKYVSNGDYLAMGGFGHVRISMSAIYEMIRQGKRDLAIAGKTAVHDIEILVAGDCIKRVDRAYSGAHEVRGLSPAFRRAAESGRIEIQEWSNASFQWRFRAAAMGIPFMPTRILMGTDTFKFSGAKVVKDPFTGMRVALLPACYPDVVFIHVHRCDVYGNCQIDGITIEDIDLSRAARKLVVTTEKIIENSEIRREPWRTTIPFYYVDAVCEIPYGSHPGNMPYEYYFDEEHIGMYMKVAKTSEGAKEYIDKYVRGVDDFEEYLGLIGGLKKLAYLRRLEALREQLKAPWAVEKDR